MPLSVRLDEGVEKKINQIARRLHIRKSEIIRRCLKKFLSEVAETSPRLPYQVYKKQEGHIPGSGHGSLSVDHRAELLKRIRRGVVS